MYVDPINHASPETSITPLNDTLSFTSSVPLIVEFPWIVVSPLNVVTPIPNNSSVLKAIIYVIIFMSGIDLY